MLFNPVLMNHSACGHAWFKSMHKALQPYILYKNTIVMFEKFESPEHEYPLPAPEESAFSQGHHDQAGLRQG